MALKACEVCGASIQVSPRDAEVVCSACGSEYDVVVHALAYSIYFYVSPTSGSAPLVVNISGGVTVDGYPYVATVYIYRDGVLIKTVRSDGLYGTFETYDVLTVPGTYNYHAEAMGVKSVTRTVTVTAPPPPPVKIATSITLVGSPLSGTAPLTVALWATLSDQYGGGVGGRTVSFYMNDKFIFSRITDATGRITTSVDITKEGTYKIVAEFAGDEKYEPSTSNVVTIKVSAPPVKKPTEMSIVLWDPPETSKLETKTVPIGSPVKICSTLWREPWWTTLDGKRHIIYHRVNAGSWVKIQDKVAPFTDGPIAAASNEVQKIYTPAEAGVHSFYAKFPGDADYEASESVRVSVKVEEVVVPPPTHGVKVKDWVTKKPIAGAEVVVIDIGAAVTGVDGIADLTAVIPAPGTYEVGVRKTNYKSTKTTMTFPGVNQVELVPLWAIGLGIVTTAAVGTIVIAKAIG